ncbi:hypothetical protein [Candidatus Nanobsidianus stetteri]|uniref:Uncharacterized protein n=2 Tax=Nanobsidianus stetteri TaxID=1294122 RepID=A0AAE3EEF6_NANST|nr:hypothetical protein [Candidatus Nanobsidianus stetteri]MCC5447123.1 hypothetical protein [Candidatus Nanobsidianus stetteri]
MVYMSYASMKYLSEEKLEKFINEIINTIYMSYGSPKHIIEYFKRIMVVEKVARIINRITNDDNDDNNKKDMGVNITLFLYDSPFNDGEIQITANIFGFESILNKLLSDPIFQMFWNDIKEKYGKYMDEKELYKVFEFLVFIGLLTSILEDATKGISPLNIINDTWGYNFYRDKKMFDGKLDEKNFKELAKKLKKNVKKN